MADIVDEGSESPDQGSSGSSLSELGAFDDADLGVEGKVVSARGTEDGLILRIDGRADWSEILSDLESFLGGRRKFFDGGEVSVEWLERLPTKEQCTELEELLLSQYGLSIVTRKKRPSKPAAVTAPKMEVHTGMAVPLFSESGKGSDSKASKDRKRDSLSERVEKLTASGDALDILDSIDDGEESLGQKYVNKVAKILGEELFYDEDANAKVVFGTLRSGQRVETPYSLIVVGDVNPGADLTAGGDVIVFGSLRGTAHASAYDDDSFDNVIIALQMQPMQLRIGSVISRGSDEAGGVAEIARIESRRIIVEPYNARELGRRLR